MLSQLHFLQPFWLLALIPLAIVWWLIVQTKVADSKAWAKVIDANLLPLLLTGSNEKHNDSCCFGKSLLAIGWIIATLALADPVWEKVPRPIFQTNSARVIVLDLSSSMLIADLKPSRLARARFKVEDILSENFAKKEEGQIGLVLFAGDAFIASPLTRDTETIRGLLQVLTPSIMPSQGSRADLGLQKAHELLTQAGIENGHILLIADGVSDEDATLKVAKNIQKAGHSLSVLGVGTEAGGILPTSRYPNGKSIMVKLDSEILEKVALRGGGKYHLISTNNIDLQNVLSKVVGNVNKPLEKNNDLKSNDWQSTGPYILLLLLPLAALAFRRGWLFTILIAASLLGLMQPQPVMAASPGKPSNESQSQNLNSIWDNLWRNKEQQADTALKNQEYDKANSLSNNPLMRGTANYKKGEYEKALKDFKQAKGADARYNEGNALAKMGKYKEAIEAYDEALKLQPDMDDAKKNKSSVKKIMKQEKKKHKKSDSDKDQKDGKEKKKDKDSGKDGKPKKGKEGKEGKASDNQFSDANKKLDEKKKDEGKSAEEKTQEEANKKKNNLKVKENKGKEGTKTEVNELSKEEKMAAEQWLRRIPDDPGGLLRRKFQQQYKRRKQPTSHVNQPW